MEMTEASINEYCKQQDKQLLKEFGFDKPGWFKQTIDAINNRKFGELARLIDKEGPECWRGQGETIAKQAFYVKCIAEF